MENKALWTFFKNNAETIQELTDSFSEYRNSLYQKIYQLNDTIAKDEFAPLADKQWIYKEPSLLVLVFDYTIDSKYKLAVDTTINIDGWEIQLFGRNGQSTDFIFNVMCKDNNFLPKPFESYEKGDRLIYHKFDTDTEISVVAKTLTDLLERIENYIEQLGKISLKHHKENVELMKLVDKLIESIQSGKELSTELEGDMIELLKALKAERNDAGSKKNLYN